MYILLLHLYLFLGGAFVYASPSSYDRRRATNVVTCLESHQVPYSMAGSSNWAALIKPFNLRLAYIPAVVTIPTTPDQVSSSVTCATAASLRVQAKGGGHSYASYSTGGQNGSMVISMENFSNITVDQSTFIAKVGAGQRLGNVALALYAQGQRALPHGTCPGVGIAGHALHGGYGYDSRKWGLTLDHIVALDVVLANGTQIHTTSTSYPDIFFAMRGAGDSFAIATYFYLSTVPAPSSTQYFTADLSASLSSAATAANGFVTLQNYVITTTTLTPDLTFGLYIDSEGDFNIQGWCIACSTTTTKSLLSDLLSGFKKTSPVIQNLDHDTFYAKSLVTRDVIPLSTKALTSYFTYILANQGAGPFFSIINLYGGPNSAINTPASNSSAYSDRSALWVLQNYGYTSDNLPPYDGAITTIVDDISSSITNVEGNGEYTAYLNYVDPGLSAATAAQLYYGAPTYDQLLGIKVEVDPGLLFWNPQSIGTTPAF
ncbi:hypothetical protein G7Y89_g11962 [Cudoniella acicularis]|uniref:FAD-binding PCMH-type domain-containing protein n=1 Tax=Cudoniella acicularis TaxID=354080 RepID=A0A8H4RCQ8_9HELO|nr:hypothetical protein G7Y89_g11962 [Cudoniella acicularis]